MTIEQMTPEEEVKLRLAAGISPSTSTEYMLRHIPLWVKMSILRRNLGAGGGGTTERVTTYDFTTNTYRKNGSKVSLGDVSEFIRLSSATMWQGGNLVEVGENVPRISGDGLLIEPQSTNSIYPSNEVEWLNYTTPSTTELMNSVGQALGVPISALKCVASGILRTATAAHISNGLVPATISVVAKAEGGGRIFLAFSRASGLAGGVYFDPATEELEVISDDRISDYGFERLSEGFYRIWVTRIPAPHATASGWVHYSIGLTNANVGDRLLVTLMGSADDPTPTSPIPTTGTPETRSPDILNIPLLPTQTITGDWDEGVAYEVADNIATFTGHGYIRNITVEAL